jgi:acetyltransferase-like isoleucine patch superfamily enzyme
VLDGAILRRGCVVGAGSVVRGEIPPYAVCVGAPARVIRYRGAPPSQADDASVPDRATGS